MFVCIINDTVQLFLDQSWSQKAAVFVVHFTPVQNSLPEHSNVLKQSMPIFIYNILYTAQLKRDYCLELQHFGAVSNILKNV